MKPYQSQQAKRQPCHRLRIHPISQPVCTSGSKRTCRTLFVVCCISCSTTDVNKLRTMTYRSHQKQAESLLLMLLCPCQQQDSTLQVSQLLSVLSSVQSTLLVAKYIGVLATVYYDYQARPGQTSLYRRANPATREQKQRAYLL